MISRAPRFLPEDICAPALSLPGSRRARLDSSEERMPYGASIRIAVAALAVTAMAAGCSSSETGDGSAGPARGTPEWERMAGASDKEYAEGIRKEGTAESMSNFDCLPFYQEALLNWDAAVRKAPEGWERESEARGRIKAVSAKVEKIKKWKAVLDEVRCGIPNVSKVGSLRASLLSKANDVLDESDVAFVTGDARKCIAAISAEYGKVVAGRLEDAARKAKGFASEGKYAEALETLDAFPREEIADYPDLKDRIAAEEMKIKGSASEDFDMLVKKRVGLLIARKSFHGAAYAVRKAKARFTGFNAILDALDDLEHDVQEAREKAEAAAKPAKPPEEKPKPEPAPKPKPEEKPQPKPEPKPDPKPDDGGDPPFGPMGGTVKEVKNPLKKAKAALEAAREYDRKSMPGADNYDQNLGKAVDNYRTAAEMFELCLDNGIGKRQEIEETLEEINQALFWCQKRRRI